MSSGIRVKHKIISDETRRLYSRDVIDPRVVSQYRVQLTAGGSDVIQLNTSLVFLATDVDKLLRWAAVVSNTGQLWSI